MNSWGSRAFGYEIKLNSHTLNEREPMLTIVEEGRLAT